MGIASCEEITVSYPSPSDFDVLKSFTYLLSKTYDWDELRMPAEKVEHELSR